MVAIAAIVLILLNPDMEDFAAFAREQSALLMQEQVGGGMLGRVLSGAGADVVGGLVEKATERNSYLIFSTYTLDFDGASQKGNEWRFLGIAGTFFELERPEAIK